MVNQTTDQIQDQLSGKASPFDFDLSDAIADLEVDLDSAGWPSGVLQIATGTREELQAFFDREQSLQVYDDGNGSPHPRPSPKGRGEIF